MVIYDTSEHPTTTNKRKGSPNLQGANKKKSSTISLSDMVIVDDDIPEASINTGSNTRSIYITRFKSSTESSHIWDHLIKLINWLQNWSDKIICTKLVSNIRKCSSLSYISFKLLVPEEIYAIFMDKSHWPPFVRIKDLRQKPKLQATNGKRNEAKTPRKLSQKIGGNYQTPMRPSYRQQNTQANRFPRQSQRVPVNFQMGYPNMMYYPLPPQLHKPYQHTLSHPNYNQQPYLYN